MNPSQEVGRINLRPAEPTLDGHQLDDLIDVWLEACAARLPQLTVDGYGEKVAHFRRWWAAVGPGQGHILRRADLVRFEQELRTLPNRRDGQPLGFNSRHDILRRLRQMFKWANRAFYVPTDYSVWVPFPDGEPPKRKAAPLSALGKLMAAAVHGSCGLRDRAIIALLIGTGVRRSEVASLNVEDVKFFPDHSAVASVRGKRTRRNRTGERMVAIDSATGVYVKTYIAAVNLSSGPLFRSINSLTQGQGLTPQGIHKVVKRAIRDAGLESVVQGCHDLRRAFATHVARQAKNEGAADLLRRQMGHATYRMTTEYVLADVDDIRKGIQSPLAAIDEQAKKKRRS